MSDMEQSDLVTPEVPAEAAAPVEPVAPEQPVVDAPAEPVVESAPAVPTLAVVAQQPSSASPTQQPESAPVVEETPLPLEDAVRAFLIFVKGRRVVGDGDLDAALADVEAALPAQDEQA